jgi:monoamine oxidase
MKHDTIIIGAGAAGLMAMKDLLNAGYRVCLLEATAMAGGRIATVKEPGFHEPVETGAEFVHGRLLLTLTLLDKANIIYVPVKGKMIAVQNEHWKKNEAHDKHWKLFMQQLGKLKKDIRLEQFLKKYFPGEKYTSLRKAVKNYAEGFDLSDISKASAMAAQREWGEDKETQYRIPGGYTQLIHFLQEGCVHQDAVVHFNAVVTKIEYNKESVTVYTKDNRLFEASKLLISVSAGVLQSGALEFIPALDTHYTNAIQQLGFGSVIKILLEFTLPFWTTHATDIGFLLSDETIPTWWTQLPIENNLLTGWLGGPAAIAESGETDDTILESALQSLAAIFGIDSTDLQQLLIHYKINCWHNHPYVKGGYSYNTTESAHAKKILSHPAEGIIFFAGEAVYGGESQGTVEAALQSGRQAAKKIKKHFPSKIHSPQI